MRHAIDDDQPGPGPRFWIPWAIGEALLLTGYVALLLGERGAHPLVRLGLLTAGFTIAQAAYAFLPWLIRIRSGAREPMRPPQRRYVARFLVAMGGFALAMAGVFGLLPLVLASPVPGTAMTRYEPPAFFMFRLASLVPAAFLLLVVRALALYLKEETDEYQRVRTLLAHVWAAYLTLGVCTVYGFLNMLPGLGPDLPFGSDLWIVFPLWCLCLGPGPLWARARLG